MYPLPLCGEISSWEADLILRQRLAYLGCSLAVGVFNAFNNFTLTLWLSGFTSSLLLISFLGNSKSFEGGVVSTIAGAWSDRTWAGWLGRRRVFILVGGLLSALILALTPVITTGLSGVAAGLVPAEYTRVAPAILAVVLFTLTFNFADDIHKALLPDVTTEGPDRNQLSSWAVVTDMGGQVLILVIGGLLWTSGIPDSAFAVTGALIAAGTLLTVIGVPEHRQIVEEIVEPKGAFGLRAMLTDYRPATIVILAIACYWFGVNAVLPLISLYLKTILGATEGEAQILPAFLLLSTTLLAIPMGLLGTRFGKRRTIGFGYIVMGIAAISGLFISTKTEGAALFLFAGVGNAASMVLTIPLLADLVPKHRMGLATGSLAAATAVAAPLSSLAGGSLSELFGPRAIFGILAVMCLVALGLLPFTRRTELAPIAET